ncbi:MAG: GreA/GreB family elongation factor [Betaproteobacteria bacterium]|nr:GreA/GreB family elongation factor [Betaproteobacteria bacterium]
MSQAFVKEQDEALGNKLPDRPQSDHPNYVTPQGLSLLHDKVHALQEQRTALDATPDDPMKQQRVAEVERDLRYCQGRIERAVVVDLAKQPADEVHFGAVVQVRDEKGESHEFTVVGEDEADVVAGKVSWVSPLAKAMLGSKVGDTVTWQRPAGNVELEITRIRYPV